MDFVAVISIVSNKLNIIKKFYNKNDSEEKVKIINKILKFV